MRKDVIEGKAEIRGSRYARALREADDTFPGDAGQIDHFLGHDNVTTRGKAKLTRKLPEHNDEEGSLCHPGARQSADDPGA